MKKRIEKQLKKDIADTDVLRYLGICLIFPPALFSGDIQKILGGPLDFLLNDLRVALFLR